jgi:Carboxypeptidase regulatory-like domain
MRFAPSHLGPIALLIAAASSAEAQILHGRVVDRVSGDAIASASVFVVNSDESIRTGAVTDRDGRFHFRTSPGTFHLRVQRVGYATTGSIPLELGRGDTLSFDVQLVLRPARLDSLTITATSAGPRDPSGFFRRQTDRAGRFLGPYEVDRRRPVSPADLLHDIPCFQVTPRMGGYRVMMTGRNRRCEPTVYVDGLLAYRGTQTDHRAPPGDDDGVVLDALVNANSICAMEAYQSGATAPVRFRPVGPIGGGDCGVLVFWTRLGFGR